MSYKLQSLKGTKDLLPEEYAVHNHVVQSAFAVSSLYGFEQMSTPILEYSKVFNRTLGETSDIVSKEMYSFLDKGDREVSLRPEFTAGIIRAFISNNLIDEIPLRFASHGPVFRYDNPQAGRQRQFHQINFEHIGAKGAYTDAEIIKLAADILKKINILDELTLEINSLGCFESRQNYQKALIEYFIQYEEELSHDSKIRLHKNPLRIMDSKDEKDKQIASNAPLIDKFHTKDSAIYFDNVQEYLNELGVRFVVNKKLARGLDYYSHTSFEFITNQLGAQSTVLAGGRYDGLSKLMGGPDVPAIGFAGGVERISMLYKNSIDKNRSIFIMPISQMQMEKSINIAMLLRSHGYVVIIEGEGKMSKRMQKAVKKSAKYVVFIGEEEVVNNNLKVKNLDLEKEEFIKDEELTGFLKQHINNKE